MELLLIKRGAEAASDEAAQKFFEDYLAGRTPAEEIHARHILVETEEEAKEVVAALEGGADFAELAKENSTGPSGPQGGDLGWFTAEQMVPEFSKVAYETPVGEFSQPVKTQFGWHVIEVEEKREQPAPSFEEVEGEIREALAREAQRNVILEVREGADIKRIEPEKSEEAPAAEAEEPAAEEPAAEEPKE